MGATVRLDLDGDATDLQRAAGQAGDALDGLGKDISGKTAAFAAAGAGLAVGLAGAFTASLDMEAAQAKFAAQLGGSADYAKDMGAIAGNLYANAYGENLGEVNEALKAVLQQGLLPEDALDADIERVTGKVMSLASAFDQDVATSVNAVGQMIKTGLAPDAETAMDIITRGFQQGVNKADDMLETLTEYGTQFRKLGLDGSQALGLMSQGLQGGARDADTVADALKEFSLIAIDGTGKAGDGYKALGMNAAASAKAIADGGPAATAVLDQVLDGLRGMTDPVAKNAAGLALFGTKWEDMGAAMNSLDVSSAAAALGTVAGAAGEVDKILGETAGAKLESVKRGFQEWTNSIVGVQGPLGTVAASVMTFGGDAIGIAGSIGMTAMAVSQLGVVSKVAAAGQWLLNAALSANPIGLVVIAIAALVGGLIWAYNNVGWFKDGVDAAFGFVVDVVGGAIDWVVNAWQVGWAWFEALPEAAGSVIGSIGDWFASLPGLLLDSLLSLGALVLNFWLVDLPNGIFFALGYLAGMIYNGAVAAWDFLVNTLPGVIESVLSWLGSLPGLAVQALGELGMYLLQVATDAWNWFTTASTTGAQITLDWIATIPGRVGEFLLSLPGVIGSAAVAAWDWFLRSTTAGGQAALDWVAGVPGRIGGFFAGAGSWLVDAGKNIVLGLWNGLKSVAQGVIDWIANLGAQIAAGFNAAVGNHSPSVIFRESGRNMMRGAELGQEDLGPNVIASAMAIGEQTTDAYATAVSSPSVGLGPAGGAGRGGAAQVTFSGDVDSAFASAFMRLVREDKIKIKAA